MRTFTHRSTISFQVIAFPGYFEESDMTQLSSIPKLLEGLLDSPLVNYKMEIQRNAHNQINALRFKLECLSNSIDQADVTGHLMAQVMYTPNAHLNATETLVENTEVTVKESVTICTDPLQMLQNWSKLGKLAGKTFNFLSQGELERGTDRQEQIVDGRGNVTQINYYYVNPLLIQHPLVPTPTKSEAVASTSTSGMFGTAFPQQGIQQISSTPAQYKIDMDFARSLAASEERRAEVLQGEIFDPMNPSHQFLKLLDSDKGLRARIIDKKIVNMLMTIHEDGKVNLVAEFPGIIPLNEPDSYEVHVSFAAQLCEAEDLRQQILAKDTTSIVLEFDHVRIGTWIYNGEVSISVRSKELIEFNPNNPYHCFTSLLSEDENLRKRLNVSNSHSVKMISNQTETTKLIVFFEAFRKIDNGSYQVDSEYVALLCREEGYRHSLLNASVTKVTLGYEYTSGNGLEFNGSTSKWTLSDEPVEFDPNNLYHQLVNIMDDDSELRAKLNNVPVDYIQMDIHQATVNLLVRLPAIHRIDENEFQIDPIFARYICQNAEYRQSILHEDITQVTVEYARPANSPIAPTGNYSTNHGDNTSAEYDQNNPYHRFAFLMDTHEAARNEYLADDVHRIIMTFLPEGRTNINIADSQEVAAAEAAARAMDEQAATVSANGEEIEENNQQLQMGM